MVAPSDALRAALARQKLGSLLTTPRPSNVEIRVDGPTHRWYVPPSSAPLLAIAWQLGRLRPVLPLCASGLIAYTSLGASARFVEPWHLLQGVCQMRTLYVLLIMRGCISAFGKTYSHPVPAGAQTADLVASCPPDSAQSAPHSPSLGDPETQLV